MVDTGSPAAVRAGTGQVNSTADSVTRASTEAMRAGTGNMRSVTTFESAEERFCEARVRTMYVIAAGTGGAGGTGSPGAPQPAASRRMEKGKWKRAKICAGRLAM